MPVTNYQPSLVITQFIARGGVYPPRPAPPEGSLSAPPPDELASYYSLGMIRMFAGNFDPGNDLTCSGQLLSIASNTALFSLLGTTYGGDGMTTFALPDLRGRVAVGEGQGPGLFHRQLGEQYGVGQLPLTQSNLPPSSGGVSQDLTNEQPALATTWMIRVEGTFQGGTDSVAIGSLAQFAGNFAPTGHLPCDGRLLSIAEHEVLFILIGTTFGGDGQETFALPDLRGRSIIGTGGGLVVGETVGSSWLNLNGNVMPTDMGGSGGALDNRAPGLALNYLIATTGIFPSQDSGSAPDDAHYLGEIIVYAGGAIPNGYMRCEGQLLSIAQNSALFALLGTQYGGNGVTNFALPDFRGRVAVGSDAGAGLDVGETFGEAQTYLTSNDMPPLTINGGGGDETFYGGGSGDSISGNGGNDQLNGGLGGDLLSGGLGTDTLSGGGGADILEGGAGADTLNGGADSDTASYAGSAAGVRVSLLAGTAEFGDAAGDILTGIENLTGSAFDDQLTGDAGVNVLSGGGGADLLLGGAGGDTLNGGDGSDTASYAGSNAAVRIRLFAGTAEFGHAAGDVLTSVENLIGSAFNDQLSGDAGDNIIEGGAGADTLGGREGFDTLSYASSSARVVVNLANQTSSQGDAQGDVFTSAFEGVIGSAFNDLLNGGNGDQTIEGGLGNDALSGGNGYDTLSYRLATAGVTVSLLGGTATGMGSDTISGFERVIGSAFNDSLTGDAGDNVLIGGAGADALNGGGGNDLVDYSGSSAGVTVNLATGTGSGGDAQGDTLTSIEHLIGSTFADVLTGNGSSNILTGGAGADVLEGRGGIDTAVYAGSNAAVTINLGAGTASGGHAQGDTLTSIENLVGSAHADVLLGNGGANVFEGGAGGDVIDGEGGIDTVSYANSSAKVTVRLYDGVVGGGDAAGDVISDVENLIGSRFSDKLHGSAVANRLEGGLGNDFLYGREGDDILIGGIGTDRLNGGSGADTFVFGAADLGIKTIQDFSTTSGDIIRLDPAQFTDFADVMSATTDVAGSAVISRGGISITITGVTKAQLSAGDFEFAVAAPLVGDDKDDALILPPLDDGLDPLILPAGLDGKTLADEAPVICPPGEVDTVSAPQRPILDVSDLGLSTFGGRDPHRFLITNQPVDWIV
jgi:microcystin-dependent protein